MLKAELIKVLEKHEIPFDPNAKVAELQSVYDKALADGAFDTKPEQSQGEGEKPSSEAVKEEKPEEAKDAQSGYKVLSSVKFDGVRYEKGQYVELPEELAKPLIKDGVLAK